jgi:hypothetical protein
MANRSRAVSRLVCGAFMNWFEDAGRDSIPRDPVSVLQTRQTLFFWQEFSDQRKADQQYSEW